MTPEQAEALMVDEDVGEPDDCPYCGATGEGHYDGTICQPCRGTGKQVGGGWDEDYAYDLSVESQME